MKQPTEESFRADLARVTGRALFHPVSRGYAGLILETLGTSKRISSLWDHIAQRKAQGFTLDGRDRVVATSHKARRVAQAKQIDISQSGRVALAKLPDKVHRACREEARCMADSAGLEGSNRGSYLRTVTAVLVEAEARKLASYPHKPSKQR